MGNKGGLKLSFFNRVKGWFVHVGNVALQWVWSPVFIRHQTVIVMATAIEHLPDPALRKQVKRAIQAQASLHGVESYLHKTIKTEVEDQQ